MNLQEARERAEQEAADQVEEERVAREDAAWRVDQEGRGIYSRSLGQVYPPLPPWLFADERSQRKAEAMAREERSWDDYSPWQNEQLF